MNPVAVTPEFSDITTEIIKNQDIDSSVIMINSDLKSNLPKYYPKLQSNTYFPAYPTYIISDESIDIIKAIQSYPIKESIMWNILSLHLIIGKNCGNASQALQAAWKVNAITSFFICRNESSDHSTIYTYNPYTNRAPKRWIPVRITDKPNDRWTLYKQHFVNDAKICKSLKFDKSEFLDGYPIIGHVMSTSKRKDKSNNTLAFDGLKENTCLFYENIFSALNITPVLDKYDNIRGLSKTIGNDSYDIVVHNPQILYQFDKYKFGDPMALYQEGGFIIVTQKQSTISVLEQVADIFFTKHNIIMSSVILIVIFFMIFLNHRYDFFLAALDLLALILNMGISAPIDRMSMRITFVTAAMFVFFFNPELQGQLTSALSRPARKNVDTLEDLRDGKYITYVYTRNIYYNLKDSQVWPDGDFKKYVHAVPSYRRCLEEVVKNSSLACIIDHSAFKDIDSTLYLSKELWKSYNVFALRKTWPLKNKIDHIALKMSEAGFTSYLERRNYFRKYLIKKKILDRIKRREENDQLDLEDFNFFLLCNALCVLLLVSILVIELIIKKIHDYHKRRLRELELRKLKVSRKIAEIVRRIAIVTEQI
ncbi:uncharacterized protein LOC130665436 isoform X2 [Microplitis mediator]|nr:uncharacterized protein LOC130665436 isoform X2 [Microplitis mediator]XP_057321803.1 uncharacterized protein LOC130665436 isoform X2 [Microplitis mediator]XP_057321804.1 uncharacterized protein LOC130665436 isoform X2 [Microplitis mediator]XP_057321805.1 uncharacterized protein LOC130665436 isoform X2 [Microplitis mediator]XP_057321806.1 uncharacterized protein LOC130665436 isoform X2 [Microplitis mediator]